MYNFYVLVGSHCWGTNYFKGVALKTLRLLPKKKKERKKEKCNNGNDLGLLIFILKEN